MFLFAKHAGKILSSEIQPTSYNNPTYNVHTKFVKGTV